MAETTTENRTLAPRWKTILDELRLEVPKYAYGSRFYTIADICEKFSVSAITARRVLTELQREGLVEKIPKRGTVIRHVASTMTVRWIVPSEAQPTYFTANPVMMRLYAGVTGAAQARDVDFASIPEARVTEMYADRDETVGFIIPDKLRRVTLDFLLSRKMPSILLDPTFRYRVPGVSSVSINRKSAGYLATKHLIELGHRRIAYVLGSIASPHFRQRLNGYRKALKEADIKFRWSLIHETDARDQWENDNAMNLLLDLRPRPTAVLTGDDDRAIWILKYCKEHGIRVPEDFSILGYPNYAESALTNPPLSVLDAQYEKVGRTAIDMILDQLSGHHTGKPRRIIVEPEPVLRGSTGPAPKSGKSS